MGYVVASAKFATGGATVIPVIPPNITAIKCNARIDYDFDRRSLGVESSNPQDIISVVHDI